ncbi:outer membrane protein transport protein [Sulfurimonas sp. SWIR-19]|uniref:OmpP1/FadL family transporter n=1 Tax=Sulfurimonas sp. SWIR-19 TaxID=2878390 RepID=UPI001CF1B85E|nr:outer membrane protein transport protein [Sulfurimonas sp. SWIR-19]UCN00301.1 outer membrane protein transport protein [Sulfurimonas sp. SWIR-19]
MKKTIKLAVVAALALGATSAFATNGSTLIGMGAKSRGMAGTSIGISHGAESALSNPAMITGIKKDHEISFGGTLFMPNVKTDGGSNGTNWAESDANMNMIPEVSLATKVNDNFYWGIGMWGTAGMGVDYRDSTNPGTMNMVTNLQIMQFGVPLAYTTAGFTVAIAPILQYGALDINYKTDLGHVQYDQQGNPVGPVGAETVGEGVAQDLAFGYTLGLSYQMEGLTIGAVYKAEIEMDYKGQLSSATQPFVDFGIFPAAMKDKLSTPAEMGVGVSYAMGEHTIALDYKQIKWSTASGYEDFGWDDQNVIAVGYEYATKGWAVRLGYNYASNPIKDAGSMTVAQAGAAAGGPNIYPYLGGNALNTFNLLGFPATTESHIGVGGSYVVSDTTSIDVAYTYAPETETTLQTMPTPTGQDVKTTVKHSQTALTVQLTYAF